MITFLTWLQLTGTWYAVARYPATNVEDLEIVRIIGSEHLSIEYSLIYVTSR